MISNPPGRLADFRSCWRLAGLRSYIFVKET